jgi:predicted RNA-binding Zn-ribbon protein involved in translation (DUF1610 family)
MLPRKLCQSCNKEIQDGETVVRVQYGKIGYAGHISLYRKASTDDYFCEDCGRQGSIAIRKMA